MSVFVKRLGEQVPPMEIVFFRSWVNFAWVAIVMLARRESFLPSNRKLLVFRGVVGFGGVSCLFYAITQLPLAVATLINWSSPVFVIVFSRVFIGERIRGAALAWIGLALFGLVLLVRPDLGSRAPDLSALPWFPVGVALCGAAFGGLAYVAVRAATAKVGVNAIVLYFTGVATLLSAPWAWADFRMPGAQVLGELLLVGTLAAIGQVCMTQGYRHAAAGLVSTMGLLNAVFSVLLGWMLFGEALVLFQWLGMALLGIGIAAATRAART